MPSEDPLERSGGMGEISDEADLPRAACHSHSAEQSEDYGSRGVGIFDCEFGLYESREHRGCEEGGGWLDRRTFGYPS